MVDPQVVALLLGVRGLAVAEPGVERLRHPGPRPRLQPVHVELVDGERERLHLLGPEQAAGCEVVVLGEAVGERRPLDQDHPALVAEQPADGEADQHDEDRHVEDQVAGFSEVAALPADRVARVVAQPVAPAPQHHPRVLEVVGNRVVGGVRRVVGQPGQVPRRGRRLGPQAAPVDQDARDEAADQRDHQQDVDGREPRRVEDREEVELLVDRGELRVLLLPPGGAERVDALLRDHRPRHRRQREQQQQHERGPHRGELAPGPAQHLPCVQLAGPALLGVDAHTGTSKSLTSWICTHETIWSHQPVTSSTPTATSISPPIRITVTWCLRTQASAPRVRR